MTLQHTMKTILALTSLTLGAAAFASTPAVNDGTCGDTCGAKTSRAALASNPIADKTIVETAVANGSFTTLASLLTSADLIGALSSKGPFTVFAPTDAAFAKLSPETVAMVTKPENKALLQDILKFHVVSGAVDAKTAMKLTNAGTLNGQRAGIKIVKGSVFVGGAKVTMTDIKCSNGIIHVIDTVMMPETKNIVEVAAGAKTFGTLIAAAKAAGLVEALTGGAGPITVFAPTDAAFAALPEGTVATLLMPENKARLVAILKYHVVAGRVFADQAAKLDKAPTLNGKDVMISISDAGAKVGNANIIATDIQASNGVIHVVDAVILP
ncbi:MAG: putative surface protein with fasciclin (FAS1) repeats [Planctomycetota bacterium]|jgi:transforming growth factor-beta-induced protein